VTTKSNSSTGEQETGELKPCPFCPIGQRMYFAVREVGWQEDRETDRRVVVVCSSCGAQGPPFGVMSFNTVNRKYEKRSGSGRSDL
jgi:hypothetical protein